MCNERTVKEANSFLTKKNTLDRRRFNKLTLGASAAMMLPKVVNAQTVSETEVEITTPDGIADCYFVHPSNQASAAVIMWPDILGLRPAFRMMGKRLAESGYAVLVVNPFYRNAKAPVVPEGASFQEEETRNIVFPLAGALNEETHNTDAKAFVNFLDQQTAVDTTRQIGTAGYCMGGPMVMRTMAAMPTRIGAGATFHGGGLATDAQNSPHLLIPTMQAQVLIAIAANDDESDPEAKNILNESFAAAGLNAEIEVYQGTQHGWCPPDSAVHNQDQAERAWGRLLHLFESALA